MAHQENARIFKALSDPKRLAILEILQEGEQCACKIMEIMDMGQSAVSYHMKILCESGVVSSRQEGKWTHYTLCAEGSRRIAEMIMTITNPAPIAQVR